MNLHNLIRELHEDNGSKIVLLVADGLGGLAIEPNGKTELESARTPNLDSCAREGACGLSIPVMPGIQIPGLEIFVEPVREHRFVVVFRGDGLGDAVNDTDPQQVGAAPLTAKGSDAAAQKTADAVNRFIAEAGKVLKAQVPTNMVTLRGFA